MNMHQIIKITIITLLWVCRGVAFGQASEKLTVLKELENLYNTYKSANTTFEVNFRYAAGETPGNYLDSLKGRFRLSGNRYWYELDNTESICTADYMIMLFKEDRVMYITTPGNGPTSPMQLPGVIPDSPLLNNPNLACSLDERSGIKIIRIRFLKPDSYRQIEYQVDKNTGYLLKMTSIVKADQLYDASVRPLVENTDQWAIVEAVYSNYRTAEADEKLFTAAHYFKKEGNAYVTVSPYEDYKVFLGKPGM